MISREILEKMKLSALKEVCRGYKLSISGKKAELFERIITYQEKLQQEKDKMSKLMTYGAEERDEGFERVIRVFQLWSDENGFWPSKLDKSGVNYELVNINEIRAAFDDYDPDASTLRKDKLVPCPGNKLEVFLEMLFNERDEWEIFDNTSAEREFDTDSEFNDRWMIEGMKKIYEETKQY